MPSSSSGVTAFVSALPPGPGLLSSKQLLIRFPLLGNCFLLLAVVIILLTGGCTHDFYQKGLRFFEQPAEEERKGLADYPAE
jgi:hypothetical protein